MCSSPNWCLSVLGNFKDYFGKHFLPISCSLGFIQMTKLALDKGIVSMGCRINCSHGVKMQHKHQHDCHVGADGKNGPQREQVSHEAWREMEC